jgi:hypothetical protein
MKTMTALAGCILFTLLIALFPLGHSAENPRGIAEPDPALISKLRDLITIREQQVEMHNVLAGAGRVSGVPSATIALAEARIELARELDQQEDVLAQMQKIVELRRGWLGQLENRTTDRVREVDIIEAHAAVIQAEVQLLREKNRLNKNKGPTNQMQ